MAKPDDTAQTPETTPLSRKYKVQLNKDDIVTLLADTVDVSASPAIRLLNDGQLVLAAPGYVSIQYVEPVAE